MPLSDEDIDRYSRQILVAEIGGRGQERLLRSSVLCVGDTDELRTAAQYLAAAGITVRTCAAPPPEAAHSFDILITSGGCENEQRQVGEGLATAVMRSDCNADAVWYSRRTRAHDCPICIGEVGRGAVRALPTATPTRPGIAAGAAIAMDAMKELLGLPGSRDVVAFGCGGLSRYVIALDATRCPHGARRSSILSS